VNPRTPTRRASAIFAADDLDSLVRRDATLTIVPWGQAGRRTDRAMFDQTLIDALLAQPPRAELFAELDPRDLYATQPFVLRSGVAYYLADEYRWSGRTYADQFKAGNKYPVVYLREGQHMILSGHHRAAAALLQGVPYRARLVEGPWGPERGDGPVCLTRGALTPGSTAAGTVFVSPSMLVGVEPPTQIPHLRCETSAMAVEVVVGGTAAWLPFEIAGVLGPTVLHDLGIDANWVRHQLHYARTGRPGPP
jgi:hypothetical protein